ncbi:hypothetical protein SDC9_179851 [bioreactor metagenome]|uniref:Uncharacterized protein n=1 Tax=bioreactor metagenome TaxID=1076179 RepID=A0A645H9A8_9ZZZZ
MICQIDRRIHRTGINIVEIEKEEQRGNYRPEYKWHEDAPYPLFIELHHRMTNRKNKYAGNHRKKRYTRPCKAPRESTCQKSIVISVELRYKSVASV